MSRNQIYDALLALGSAVQPAGSAWGETGRKLKTSDKAQMPALFQVEPDEDHQSKLGQMKRRELSVIWIIMHTNGKDQGNVPARFTADLLDLIDAAFPDRPNVQRLGGLVHAAWIEGQIRKWEGDTDGITILTVPIKLLLP
jgi:hypothetical protein